ncbi:MAG: PAS domain-containing protein, partial [Bacteroidota bacterium]
MSTLNHSSVVSAKLAHQLGGLIFNRVKEMVCWVNSEGRVIMVNDATVKKLAYTRTELLQKNAWDISAEFPTLIWEEHWANLKDKKVLRFDSIWFTKKGEPIPIDLSLHYVEVGTTAYINVIANPIEEQMIQEGLLSMIYQTLNDSKDLMVWTKADGQIFYYNEVATNVLGYPPETFARLKRSDLIQYARTKDGEQVAAILPVSKMVKQEVVLKKENDELVIAELSASIFELQGEMITCNIFRDITAKQAREDRLRELLVENRRLRQELEGAVDYLQQEIEEVTAFNEIITQNSVFQQVLQQLQEVAPLNTTVLIQGETGTGKELLARALHAKSNRGGKPLIK